MGEQENSIPAGECKCLLTVCELWGLFRLLCLDHMGLDPYANFWSSLIELLPPSRTLTTTFSCLNLSKLSPPVFSTHQSCRELWSDRRARLVCFPFLNNPRPALPVVQCLKTVVFLNFVQCASRCLQWEVKCSACNSIVADGGCAISLASSIFMIIYY